MDRKKLRAEINERFSASLAYLASVELVPLSDEDGGGYLATVPELPGCMSDGETPDEARANVQDAIKAWLATAEQAVRPIL